MSERELLDGKDKRVLLPQQKTKKQIIKDLLAKKLIDEKPKTNKEQLNDSTNI